MAGAVGGEAGKGRRGRYSRWRGKIGGKAG